MANQSSNFITTVQSICGHVRTLAAQTSVQLTSEQHKDLSDARDRLTQRLQLQSLTKGQAMTEKLPSCKL